MTMATTGVAVLSVSSLSTSPQRHWMFIAVSQITEHVKQVEGKRMYERLTGDGRRWDRPDEKAPGETVTQTSNSSVS